MSEKLVKCRSTRKRTVARLKGRVSTRLGKGRWQVDRKLVGRVLDLLARGLKAQAESFSRGELIFGDGLFYCCGSQQGASNWQSLE